MYSFYIGEKITSFSLNRLLLSQLKPLKLNFMELKKLLKTKLSKVSAFAGIALLSVSAEAQVNVTIGNLAQENLWVAYANWFENNGAFEANTTLAYAGGSGWSFADLKSTLDVGANTITLYPNYNTYEAGNAYWANGTTGNKIFEGSTMVERTDLAGQQLIFSGNTVSSTLTSSFKDVAFIKVLNPANGYSVDYHVTEELVPGENWTLSTGNFTIMPGMLVQYGLAVMGLNQNPTTETANGFTVVTAGEAEEPEEPTGLTATISDLDTPELWKAYANWFENNGAFEAGTTLAYAGGSSWSFADLKSVLDAGSNTITVYPNYNTYEAGNAYWADGDTGNKIFEGSTYVERNDIAGEYLTFTGTTISTTLLPSFEDVAFIKILNPANGYSVDYHVTADLVPGQTWNLNTGTFTILPGMVVQYGIAVMGKNQNPATEATNGFTVVGSAVAGVGEVKKNAIVMYPNPASSMLNFSSEDAIENIEIYNVMGQKVVNAKPSQNAATVDVSGLANGIYIVNILVNGKQNAARFIKQ